MQKLFLILFALFLSFCVKSQTYYGAHPGVFFGSYTIYNVDIHQNEIVKYGSFFLNMPVGYHFSNESSKFWNNWLIESELTYPLFLGLGAGRQIGNDEGNMQFIFGGGDYLVPEKQLHFEHDFSYNAIARINIGHFLIQGAYSYKTIFLGIGFKAYVFE